MERGSKWGIGEGDEEKLKWDRRGANERRCAAEEKRKWILYLSNCSGEGGREERRENLSVFIRLSSCNVLVLWWLCSYLPYWSSLNVFFPLLAYCLSRSLKLFLRGPSIIQVTASDADDPTYGNSARLVYTLVQGHPHFSVDAQTGEFFFSRNCFIIKTAGVSPCSPRLVAHWS